MRSVPSHDASFDVILVDILEDVRGADEDRDRSSDRHRHEDVEEQTVDHHGDVAPVLQDLQPYNIVTARATYLVLPRFENIFLT